jgi:hypothetical protein
MINLLDAGGYRSSIILLIVLMHYHFPFEWFDGRKTEIVQKIAQN